MPKAAAVLALVLPFAIVHGPCTARADAPISGAGVDHAQALEATLTELGLSPACEHEEGGLRCRFAVRSSLTERSTQAVAHYLHRAQTVQVYVPAVLSAPADARATTALLQRLMELNWELTRAKFAWNPRDGEVRLSAVLNTDSNFDRHALRSIIEDLDTAIASHAGPLRTLQDNLGAGPANVSAGDMGPQPTAQDHRSARP